jgi:hypothetical protein
LDTEDGEQLKMKACYLFGFPKNANGYGQNPESDKIIFKIR